MHAMPYDVRVLLLTTAINSRLTYCLLHSCVHYANNYFRLHGIHYYYYSLLDKLVLFADADVYF